jgi:hypothetical protein
MNACAHQGVVQPGDQYCGLCGEALQEDDHVNLAFPARERRAASQTRWVRPVVIALVAALCGAAIVLWIKSARVDSTRRTGSITGLEIAQDLKSRLADTSDIPVADVRCPDERLIDGESVVCGITFADGSFHDLVASPTFEADGSVHLQLDVP